MASPHPASLPIEKLLTECNIARTRRGGPGGQHRNKVSSAIVVTHRPTGVSGHASERRSQHTNRDVAIERLRVNLALAVRTDVAIDDYVPSDLWLARSKGGRLRVNARHQDFAALLAEVFDVLELLEYDIAASAKLLNVSRSQLVKFVRSSPAGFEFLNRNRKEIGLGKLK